MRIETERLVLREFVEDDWPATNAYERLPEVMRYQSSGVRTPHESRVYILSTLAEQAKVPRRLWDLAVTLRATGELVGRVGLHVVDETQKEGRLWYVLHPAHWGQGLTPEAARALLRFGFGDCDPKLHRVTADLDPRNVASLRVVEKLGMRREAHFVENYWHAGEWTDTLIYALLAREFVDVDV